MNEGERIARAHRANAALDEFVKPIIDEIEATYLDRLREISTSEFSYKRRSDKQTALSTALTITKAIREGLVEAIRDGEMAQAEKLRVEKIEKLSAPQRRILGYAPIR